MVSAIRVSAADLHFLSASARNPPLRLSRPAWNGNERMSFFWHQFYPQGLALPFLSIRVLTTHADYEVETARSCRYEQDTRQISFFGFSSKWSSFENFEKVVHFDRWAAENVDRQPELVGGMSRLLMLWSVASRLLNIIINRFITDHCHCHHRKCLYVQLIILSMI